MRCGQNGFGVVFQELEGRAAFDEVGATLDLIERLGRGSSFRATGTVFTDVDGRLAAARRRLDGFVQDPRGTPRMRPRCC